MYSKKMLKLSISVLSVVLAVSICIGLSGNIAMAADEETDFSDFFFLGRCTFRAWGENLFFKLTPEYQLILEGEEDGEAIRNVITVLADTEWINTGKPWIGSNGMVKTRVVEERESVDGELSEISRNFFARCKETNAVYYFGEDVDIYEDGKIVSHDGEWRAGKDGAKPGLIMPGTFLLGSKYFQEIAPNAQDRAMHTAMGLKVTTPAGVFRNCVVVSEDSAIEAGAESTKVYCPDVGLVIDDEFELVDYGFDIFDPDDDD